MLKPHSFANCQNALLPKGMLSATTVLGMPCLAKILFILVLVMSAVLLFICSTSGYFEK